MIFDDIFLNIIYRSLNANTKVVVNTFTGGAFMGNTYVEAFEMLYKVTKINRVRHTRESNVTPATYATGTVAGQEEVMRSLVRR